MKDERNYIILLASLLYLIGSYLGPSVIVKKINYYIISFLLLTYTPLLISSVNSRNKVFILSYVIFFAGLLLCNIYLTGLVLFVFMIILFFELQIFKLKYIEITKEDSYLYYIFKYHKLTLNLSLVGLILIILLSNNFKFN